MVQEVNDNNIQSILSENEIVCVKLWADWCEPCKQIVPKYEELSEKVPSNVMMCSLAVDENPDFTDKYNIRSIPTILLFVSGEVTQRFVGSDAVSKLESYILSI